MKLQLALDVFNLEDALSLTWQVRDYIDIIEIGTPFIMESGMNAVRRFRETFPKKEILADTKIMDAGELEAGSAFRAGADYVTVLGVTDFATIKACVAASKRCGKKVCADMICVDDLPRKISELEELGPYAAGIVEFRIPYADLEGKLDARWLFPGQRQGKGKPEVTELSELEGGETEIVDSLILNEDGQELCIVADGIIYDVSLTSVYYVDRFYDSAQLWYASCLDDCALQIRVVVPEGLPNLRIAYTTADGVRHGKLLSQSGLDGSYMLVDDDIQAVG